MIPEELLSAFRSTLYRVDLPAGRALLQVDLPSPPLRAWLESRGQACAALLTAHNPAARRHDAALNEAAQQQLHALLQMQSLHFVTGSNADPHGQWPDEPTVLVAGLPLEQARELALRFGQLALLWCDASGVPRLMPAAGG